MRKTLLRRRKGWTASSKVEERISQAVKGILMSIFVRYEKMSCIFSVPSEDVEMIAYDQEKLEEIENFLHLLVRKSI